VIWITGVEGMIGSHMKDYFESLEIETFGTYYVHTPHLVRTDSKVQISKCDVRNIRQVASIISQQKPETIFHLAAQSYPIVSWKKPQETMDVNAGGTISIFEGVKQLQNQKDQSYSPVIVVACSSAEYGASLDSLTDAVKEDALLLPLHPYGVSKVAQDLLAFQYFINDRIKCIRARIFNTTGPRKVGDVISDFIRQIVRQEREGREREQYSLRVGNIHTFRAIMDYRDTIEALVLLAKKGTPGEAYNISSGHIYQIKDIIQALENIIGTKFELIVDEQLLRPTDEKFISGNSDKLKHDTGWQQKVSLKETLEDTLVYWRSNKTLI
jgi:nucleoside-diphosphate-sugar epimerase